MSENLKIYQNEGIKKLLTWLTLLSEVNEKRNEMKYQNISPFYTFSNEIKKPRDLLTTLYQK